MDFNEKKAYIMENNKIQKRLKDVGIYSNVLIGPTGPKGDSFTISGVYNTLEELENAFPLGDNGYYLIDGNIYIWNSNKWTSGGTIVGPTGPSEKIKVVSTKTIDSSLNAEVIDNFDGVYHLLEFNIPKGEMGPRGLPGEIGISEGIFIDGTETIESNEEASVIDDFEDKTHHLTFYIPKGEKGEKGDVGEMGPTGPKGSLGPTSYDAVAFASFMDTTTSGIAQIGTMRIIPTNNDYLSIENNKEINIKRTSVFEITLCGRISGVTNNTGASFSLYNKTTDSDVSDLIFELNAGDTKDMDFSETNLVDITGPSILELKTNINGNDTINFTYMNVLIKSFKC